MVYFRRATSGGSRNSDDRTSCLCNLAVAKVGILGRFLDSDRLASLIFAASNQDASQGHCAHLVEPSATAAVLLAVTIVVFEVG